MFADKISKVGKIEEAGTFSMGEDIFYLFLSPKGSSSDTIAILEGNPIYNKSSTAVPVVVGAWNPVLFKYVKVTPEHIKKYNIFWGTEDYD